VSKKADSSQTFDPKKRVTVEEALAHPYLEAYVSIADKIFQLLPSNPEIFRSMTQMTNQSHPHWTQSSSNLIVSFSQTSIPI
jgi:hypothetical protein